MADGGKEGKEEETGRMKGWDEAADGAHTFVITFITDADPDL